MVSGLIYIAFGLACAFPLYLVAAAGRFIALRARGGEAGFPFLSVAIWAAMTVFFAAALLFLGLKSSTPMIHNGKALMARIYTHQLVYFAEHESYFGATPLGGDASRADLYLDDPGTVYSVRCGEALFTTKMSYGAVPTEPEIDEPASAASRDGFTCLAWGNLDRDEYLDVWSVNDAKDIRHLRSDEFDLPEPALAGARGLVTGIVGRRHGLFFALGWLQFPFLLASLFRDVIKWRRAKSAATCHQPGPDL